MTPLIRSFRSSTKQIIIGWDYTLKQQIDLFEPLDKHKRLGDESGDGKTPLHFGHRIRKTNDCAYQKSSRGFSSVFVYIIFVFFLPRCFAAPINERHVYNVYDLKSFGDDLELFSLSHDQDSTRWAIFSSNHFSFYEFWISYEIKDGLWHKPAYTGIPTITSGKYRWTIEHNALEIELTDINHFYYSYSRNYARETVDTKKLKNRIVFGELARDSDLDGLTDLSENVIWTDPLNNDSDGDGKADGFDQNPLAAPANSLKILQRLHKHIIEQELRAMPSGQLVIVEQFDHQLMEYERDRGLILNMPSDTIDAYVNVFGWGTPILTAAVKDTLRMYKVRFQFFIAPDDAWGYEALYDWDKKRHRWIRKRIWEDWIAE
ncbi:hypothetical protein A2V82_13970 [candidate division KSB1 bacterium RBG_16_48_16]|nr:MAG: hypothetical protein A2V82_13970 [candidate division KSB1 bacterium RBG_16_48_16]